MLRLVLVFAVACTAPAPPPPPPELDCDLPAADCALEVFDEHLGALSDACAETVRNTAVTLGVTAAVLNACGANALGCVTHYETGSATVMVQNDADRHNTEIHELLHIAIRCARGTFDSTHTAYGAAWVGLITPAGSR